MLSYIVEKLETTYANLLGPQVEFYSSRNYLFTLSCWIKIFGVCCVCI